MKEWLRQHPEHAPPGLDATGTNSRRVARALRARSWQVQESTTDYRLILPGTVAGAELVTDVLGGAETNDIDDAAAVSFDLEAQLRDFIVANLSLIQVGNHRVSVFTDSNGRSGVEYPTGVGPIDILAEDDTGGLVVVELKVERGPDKTLGQLARYMGWVRRHLANGRKVSGVIVARRIDERLRYAALVIPDIALLEYELDFRLKPAGNPGSEDVG